MIPNEEQLKIRVSWGVLFWFVVTLVGGGMAWADLRGRVVALETSVHTQHVYTREEIDLMRQFDQTRVSEIDARLNRLERRR